jgi:hypothetical protein
MEYKYRFTIFDDNENIKEQHDYNKITDITKDYKIPYGQLYYILQYYNGNIRKPGKRMQQLMKRFSLENINI